MSTRKTKAPTVNDIRIQQVWQIQPDENGHEHYVCTGWEIQVQRGAGDWVSIDVDNVVIDEKTLTSAN